MTSDHPFFALGDGDLNKLTTAAFLRSAQRGAADLGGRMRVASILRSLDIDELPSMERIAGSTNEVWRASPYVVRVGFVPGADRLRREAKIAAILPSAVNYPRVIASGSEEFGEWIVVRNVPAAVLSAEWRTMSSHERRLIVMDIGEALQAVHNVPIDAASDVDLTFHEDDGALALPQQMDTDRLRRMLDDVSRLPNIDVGLVRDADDRLQAVADAFGDEPFKLIHGDLHFGNVLSLDGVFVSLLDFEWSRLSRPELDIEMLGRYCANPELHEGNALPATEYREVLCWLNEGYPELFAVPRLGERLTHCALAFEIPSLLRWPPEGPAKSLSEHHPVNRLRTLLDRGSHAERLGWEPGESFTFG